MAGLQCTLSQRCSSPLTGALRLVTAHCDRVEQLEALGLQCPV